MHLIYDLAIAAILVGFFLCGRNKGFVMSLCNLLAVFVAIIGAKLCSDFLTPILANTLQPHFSQVIQEEILIGLGDRVNDLFAPGSQLADNAIADILRQLGLYDQLAGSIRDAVTAQSAQTVADVAAALALAVAEVVASVIIFVVAFLIISVLWFLFSHTLNLAAKLPIIHSVNTLLGGVFGLLQGVALLFLAAWVMRLMGEVIPQELVEQTRLLKFFCNTNPMDLIASI